MNTASAIGDIKSRVKYKDVITAMNVKVKSDERIVVSIAPYSSLL